MECTCDHGRMRHLSPAYAPAVVLAVLSLALAACGGSSGSSSTTSPAEPAAPPPPPSGATGTTAVPISLYAFFLREGKVAAARREVPETKEVGSASLRALVAGPTSEERAAGMTTEVPPGLKWTLSIAGGVATLRVSPDVDDRARAQLTYTLTQFPTVRRVDVNGETGSRASFEQLTPAILVESPVVGDSVSSPLHVTGTANTFEATFTLELRASGRLLARKAVSATSGLGTRGTFDTELSFDVAEETRAEVVAYEVSPKDGSHVNTVRIPIRLLP